MQVVLSRDLADRFGPLDRFQSDFELKVIAVLLSFFGQFFPPQALMFLPYSILARGPVFRVNYTEIELSVLARQCLGGRIASKQHLIDKVTLWQNRRNSLVVKVDWQFTTADARIKLKHLYPSIVT